MVFSVGLFLVNILHLSTGLQELLHHPTGSFFPHLPVHSNGGQASSPSQDSSRLLAEGQQPGQAATGVGPELTVPMIMPTSVTLKENGDMDFTLCSLDLAPYHKNPEKYPMSNDLDHAFCHRNKVVTRSLSDIEQVRRNWRVGLGGIEEASLEAAAFGRGQKSSSRFPPGPTLHLGPQSTPDKPSLYTQGPTDPDSRLCPVLTRMPNPTPPLNP